MGRPTYQIDEKTAAERSRIEDRALWLYFLFKEMEREVGKELAEKISRRSVSRFGALKDEAVGKPATPDEWVEKHARGSNPAVFEKEIPEGSSDERCFRMYYCSLKSAWEKVGASEEELDLLCDIAMDGDRARCGGGVSIEITKRMCDRAKKPGFCEVVIRKYNIQ